MTETTTKETVVTNDTPVQTTQTTQQVVQRAPVEPTTPQQAYQKKKAIFRTYQYVWYILGLIEVLLAFRLILKMLGANPGSGFVSFIYGISDLFALPFAGILGTTATNAGSVFEWSTLIAMAVYLVVAWGIVKLLQLIKPTDPHEVSQVVDNQ